MNGDRGEEREARVRAALAAHASSGTMVLASGLVTGYLGFNQGGFFPASVAIVTIALLLSLIVRVGVITRPFAGLGGKGLAACAALAAFAALTLLSSAWSHAPGRAVLEFNRALLYLVVFIVFATLPREDRYLAALAAGFAVATVVLCGAGLLTRTLPHTFPLSPSVNTGRLGYPLTYRNALGLTAVLGILMCISLSAGDRVSSAVRVAAAAAVPLLAATLLLTFSRGPLVAGIGALALMGTLARRRSLGHALIASGVGAIPAVRWSYAATALAQSNPTSRVALAQGRTLVLVVACSCLLAGGLRLLFIRRQPRSPGSGGSTAGSGAWHGWSPP